MVSFVCMETQKTVNIPENLEDEEYSWKIRLPDFKPYNQSTVTKSMALAQEKTERSMKQDGNPRNKLGHLQSICDK